MAAANYCIFGDIHNPMVWTVDDDWFENAMVIKDLSLIRIDGDLSKLISQIDGIGSLESTARSMLFYLKKLATECRERHLSLCVCNFERFDEKFAYANRPGNAVLLDIHRSGSETTRFDSCARTATAGDVYGLHLLAERLGGTLFGGEIFFVTRYPGVLDAEISKCMEDKEEGYKWWPLRNISGLTVNKERPGELDTFFAYFVHRLPPEPKKVDFDIKFIVQLPLAPMLGRIDPINSKQMASGTGTFLPFLVPMIKAFGFAAPIDELKTAFRTQPDLYRERLAQVVSIEVVQNKDRWSEEDASGDRNAFPSADELKMLLINGQLIKIDHPYKEQKEQLLGAFNAFISSIPAFNSHLTLEHWVHDKVSALLSLRLNELLNKFGGGTRFDLAHGTWVDKDKNEIVEDLLVIVEFLTTRSKVSREMVQEYVVKRLLTEDAEDESIIQEIPLHGFRYKRRSDEKNAVIASSSE